MLKFAKDLKFRQTGKISPNLATLAVQSASLIFAPKLKDLDVKLKNILEDYS